MPGLEFMMVFGILGMGQLYVVYQYLRASTTNDRSHSNDVQMKVPLLCYFTMEHDWPDNGTMHPAMNATICTHMLFICVTTKDSEMYYNASHEHKYFSKIPVIRQQNPELKVIITQCGGFTEILATAANRTRFVKSTIPFMEKYDFDGLDLDWEFPGWRKYPVGQRANFSLILKELRKEFDREEADSGGKKYTLSAAVSGGKNVMIVYNVTALAEALDFINLMCYDMHAYDPDYDRITGYNSPLYPTDWDKQFILTGNVGWSSYEWHKRGMPKSKIMVGIPTYTHTWTLEFPDKYHGPIAPAIGRGRTCNECNYPWMCNFLRANGTRYIWDDDAAVPYAYNGDQWVSFDDAKSLALKADWIVQNGFGGIMVYSMNNDDYYGTGCNHGKFPLISAIRSVINKVVLYEQ